MLADEKREEAIKTMTGWKYVLFEVVKRWI
jgi:hypothetical protein